jgi:hypothetical protein
MKRAVTTNGRYSCSIDRISAVRACKHRRDEAMRTMRFESNRSRYSPCSGRQGAQCASGRWQQSLSKGKVRRVPVSNVERMTKRERGRAKSKFMWTSGIVRCNHKAAFTMIIECVTAVHLPAVSICPWSHQACPPPTVQSNTTKVTARFDICACGCRSESNQKLMDARRKFFICCAGSALSTLPSKVAFPKGFLRHRCLCIPL